MSNMKKKEKKKRYIEGRFLKRLKMRQAFLKILNETFLTMRNIRFWPQLPCRVAVEKPGWRRSFNNKAQVEMDRETHG